MSKTRKYGKWIFITLVSSVLAVVALLHIGVSMMHMNDSSVQDFFNENNIDVSIDYLETDRGDIRVVATPEKRGDTTLIVFVHGAPGGWDAFKSYMVDSSLTNGARHISYDRPGYSRGSISTPSLEMQAQVLKTIINKYRLPRVIVVGHSYGGPIVAKVLADDDADVDAAVMIAPVNNPYHEPIFWYSYFSKWPWSKAVLPTSFQVAGDEKFAHSTELQEMEDSWANISKPMLHIHGTDDGLAPFHENITWSKEHIDNEYLQLEVMEDKGHLIIWTSYDEVSKMILNFLNERVPKPQ